MVETVSSLVDFMARQAGIPSELAFVQEVTHLQTGRKPARQAHELAVLAHMRAYTAIRRDLDPHIHAAVLFQIMQAYYQAAPVAETVADLNGQARDLLNRLAENSPATEPGQQARRMVLRLMDSALPDAFKAAGLIAIERQHAHQTRP